MKRRGKPTAAMRFSLNSLAQQTQGNSEATRDKEQGGHENRQEH